MIDTGILLTHQDLIGPRYQGGYDFVNSDSNPTDDSYTGHGTHVAGIAIAETDDLLGIAGESQSAYYAVKSADSLGELFDDDVAAGIAWCTDNTISHTVISMSFGGTLKRVVVDAIAYASSHGKLLIAAAGNDGPNCVKTPGEVDCIEYPASDPLVIAVTCTMAGDLACPYSSTGSKAELSSPGDAILSTMNTPGNSAYTADSGTSYSAPGVSGAAALLWSTHPTLTASQVRCWLDHTAKDLGAPGRDREFGYGELDMYALVTSNGVGC